MKIIKLQWFYSVCCRCRWHILLSDESKCSKIQDCWHPTRFPSTRILDYLGYGGCRQCFRLGNSYQSVSLLLCLHCPSLHIVIFVDRHSARDLTKPGNKALLGNSIFFSNKCMKGKLNTICKDISIQSDAVEFMIQICMFREYLLLHYLENVSSKLVLRSLIQGSSFVRNIEIEKGTVKSVAGRIDDTQLFIKFESFVVPNRIYKLDLEGPIADVKVFILQL